MDPFSFAIKKGNWQQGKYSRYPPFNDAHLADLNVPSDWLKI